MLQLGISLESILSREPPVWQNPAGRPKHARKGKKQADNDKDKQVQENRVPAKEPKARSQSKPPHSGVHRGGSNTHPNGRVGKSGAPAK